MHQRCPRTSPTGASSSLQVLLSSWSGEWFLKMKKGRVPGLGGHRRYSHLVPPLGLLCPPARSALPKLGTALSRHLAPTVPMVLFDAAPSNNWRLWRAHVPHRVGAGEESEC